MRSSEITFPTDASATRRPSLGVFERYLTLWVALCILVGILLGRLFPAPFQLIGGAEIARVNLPVAALIWLMIIPMLLKVDFGALHRVKEHWRGMAVTLFINWAVKPFSMAALGWLFVGWLFRPWLPADQIDSYIAGLIILAAAPCTAMVFVWSNLSDGEPNFTLSQVALNDTHHGVRVRADRRPPARPVVDRRAVGHARPLGRPVHRDPSDRRSRLAQGSGRPRRAQRWSSCSRACNRSR